MLLWVPTGKGVALLGLNLSLDGVPLHKAFDARLDRLINAIDTDGKQSFDWNQLFDYVDNNPAVFGTSPSQLGNQTKNLIRRYDRNGNRLVEPDELTRFIFREAATSKPFRLFGTDALTWPSRHASPIFVAIDKNNDSVIDDQEAFQAGQSILRKLDADNNQTITLSELTAFESVDERAWATSRSSRRGEVAMDLHTTSDWSDFAYSLGGMIDQPFWYGSKTIGDWIDTDHDRWISTKEAQAIDSQVPTVIISVDFSDTSKTSLEVWIAPHTGNQIRVHRTSPDLIWIESIEGQICVDLTQMNSGDSAMMTQPNESGVTSVETDSIWEFQIRGRAASHRDLLFAFLDQDRNHRLSTREIRHVGDQIKHLGNTVTPEDLPQSTVIQLVRGQPQQDEERFRLSPVSSVDIQQHPRWVTRSDLNGDGDLSESEFIGPIDVFRRLDQNGDAFLSIHEILSAEGSSATENVQEH
ncbi:EF-hand domain-containing protein [Roseiconus lacunae]|uniref:hypothetical protein n=1 Tax=Roseiconus lacunae TaxID=2605694 RepID=UPI001E342EDB|nr:hypothetical protein [Roseiconus lacunae]MCD0459707.1 hypothetical protein [Roseiconus lacunae]